ncbi:MAG: hypothetical protein M3386_04355 [Actinomycetota bacterium]|nr:hypothetical protein [Actinomycetota bacterium]
MITAVLGAAEEEQLRDIAVAPLWIGIGSLAVFVVLLVGLLIYGKGRPHT